MGNVPATNLVLTGLQLKQPKNCYSDCIYHYKLASIFLPIQLIFVITGDDFVVYLLVQR